MGHEGARVVHILGAAVHCPLALTGNNLWHTNDAFHCLILDWFPTGLAAKLKGHSLVFSRLCVSGRAVQQVSQWTIDFIQRLLLLVFIFFKVNKATKKKKRFGTSHEELRTLKLVGCWRASAQLKTITPHPAGKLFVWLALSLFCWALYLEQCSTKYMENIEPTGNMSDWPASQDLEFYPGESKLVLLMYNLLVSSLNCFKYKNTHDIRSSIIPYL